MPLHAVLLAVLAATPSVSFAPGSPGAELLAPRRISAAQARDLALRTVPGTVLAESLERAADRWVYAFEIRPTRFERGDQRVTIDAQDGSLVSRRPLAARPLSRDRG